MSGYGQGNPSEVGSAPGYVALVSPATQTGVGVEAVFTFSQYVNSVIIQNNSGSDLNLALDSTASAGSFLLTSGQTLIYAKRVLTVHLFTAAAKNVNGTSSGNIVLLGEL